jgi:parvulin-like peptidyl-prolyl isomerase
MKPALYAAFLSAALFAQNPFLVPGSATAPQSSNPVVASIAGKDLTVSDIKEMMQNAPPQFTQAFRQNPQQAIVNYFVMKRLAEDGEKAKLDQVSPLKEQLELLRANALAFAMVNHERDGFNVTTPMIQSFYDSHLSRYEQANVKLLYIAFKPGEVDTKKMTPEEAIKREMEKAHPRNERSEAEAKQLAEEVLKKLKAGAKFTDMVAQYSEDNDSKSKGGDFGPVKSTSAYPEDVKKAIFALKPAEISSPIQQTNGFYLIQMVSKTAQPMNEVAEPIIQEIRQSHLDEWLKNLNSQFRVDVKNQDFFLKPDSFLK